MTEQEWRQLRDLAFRAQQEMLKMPGTFDYQLYGLFDTVREYAHTRASVRGYRGAGIRE